MMWKRPKFENNMAAVPYGEKSSTEMLFDLIRGAGTMATIQAYLRESGDIDIEARDSEGFTPLLLACSRRQESVVRLLMECGANVDVKGGPRNWTALHYASDSGWSDVVRSLVRKVTDVDAVDRVGHTALFIACCSLMPVDARVTWWDIFIGKVVRNAQVPGCLEVVKCLVGAGADMNWKSALTRSTPLLNAACVSKRDVVDFLLASGANADEGELLYHAASHGWSDMVRVLVKGVSDLNILYSHENETALHAASKSGHLEIVQCLVEKGADINSRDMFEHTALHRASFEGHLQVVKCLVEKTTGVDSKRGEGESTLPPDASQNGRIEVQSVVKRTCDLDARNSEGMTALAEACRGQQFQIAQYLLSAGASWKTDPEAGSHRTALNIITREYEPDFEFVKIFIENGAYLDIFDYERLVENSSQILMDVNLCCQTIINRFNDYHLPELYKLPISAHLPHIKEMKIVSGSEAAKSIKRTVELEIETNRQCNVIEVRPMVLRITSVASLLKYYEKKKSEMGKTADSMQI